MCDPATAVATVAVGAIIANELSPRVSIPKPAKPTEAPASQAAKAPDQQALRRGAIGAGRSAGPTMLTGSGGVDPASLTLGKASLLGS